MPCRCDDVCSVQPQIGACRGKDVVIKRPVDWNGAQLVLPTTIRVSYRATTQFTNDMNTQLKVMWDTSDQVLTRRGYGEEDRSRMLAARSVGSVPKPDCRGEVSTTGLAAVG